ncbi:MAG: MinD/ParA family protein [Nevskiales bacterium]
MLMPEANHNQAAGLTQLHTRPALRVPRVIAISSGKGGVGKTTVSVNLATALAASGQRTMLLDADFGLANVDVMLGLTPHLNLTHLLNGHCQLEDTLLSGPHDLQIVPSASGRQYMSELNAGQHAGIIQSFSTLKTPPDILLVDTAAGIAGNVTTFAQAAQEILIVACSEPASITDAYALIKVLSRDCGVKRVQVLANQVRSPAEGREIFDNLARVAARFLDVNLVYFGAVPYDDWLRRAIRRQQPVIDVYPKCEASQVFRNMAQEVLQWQPPQSTRGNLEFFVEQLANPALQTCAGAA